ncbi:MAG: M48 family metallopeptidase [Spirochaetales bacterium]
MKSEHSVNDIAYTLVRNKGQRNLRIHLSPAGDVLVSAPYHLAQKQIDDFVSNSASWIQKHQQKVASHSYNTGDFVPYLGKKMGLLVIDGKIPRYDIIDDKIIVTVKKQTIENVKKVIKSLYVDTIEKYMETRVPYWCGILGVPVPQFGVNRAKGKWGVCYPLEKRLYLSYMCATLPEDLIDMTVLHESCHLIHSGHGKDFWALMEKHMPDLEQRKAGLAKITKSGWSMNIV